ncbi:partitioning defective 3 homolog B isoform X2 [Microcaecilia unicolor]|uniref:Partitioning defective 3 homolog B n=1 Tax=Microcaecilia unicolor TaxID=1415580 RepID=A0A6P7YRG0_9AMPH|nr:partitioning defective 3 homolog B isoform X2 [Microcaecilia unicolor]
MKVTVCFGKTGIVVPCKDGRLSVRELIQQAVQRYIKTKEKEAGYWVKIRHLEYTDGGILDPDDVLADVVEDKDKLIAVYDEQGPCQKAESTSGNITDRLSPDSFETEVAAQLAAFQPITGEIEVTPSALKLGTPLLVRRSSDPAVGPPADYQSGASYSTDQSLKPVVSDSSHIPWEDGERDGKGQTEVQLSQKSRYTFSKMTRTVEISGDSEPLGIHVVPFYSSLSGRILGLYIRGIEGYSRSKRDGLFHENECIVKINNVDLADRTFTQAQDIFRQAMKNESVIVEVVPSYSRDPYEKSLIAPLTILDSDDKIPKTNPPPPTLGKPTVRIGEPAGMNNTETGTYASLQPSKSPILPHSDRKSSSPSVSPLGFGSKKQSKKIKIDLNKGQEGLGFTVVTRDSSVHGPGPIFVKNILPKGAAIKDGRLQSGDRILEVNGRDITGQTQEELVAMLRSTKQGDTVSMVVARQEEAFLPRELKAEPDSSIFCSENTSQLTFEIPLNDSGSAGLGVSLKGNKSRDTGADLGIFIKSVIHGGAAYKDGRLRINDQLIAVNGESLLGKSNFEAMETLRRSMSMEGNIRGMIQLVIFRRLDRQTEEHVELSAQGLPISPASWRTDNFQQPLTTKSPQERLKELTMADDSIVENEIPPPLPPHPTGKQKYSSLLDSAAYLTDQHIDFRSLTPVTQPESINLKASKSMDLVADESKISSLVGHKPESPGKDFGPTLGLKMSSSLESLQTAVAEVKKNDLPFHRPRPHMVRGRGCNESFRAAIDKSYDGPDEAEDDGASDASSHSGRETPSGELAPRGNLAELEYNDKLKKEKKKKEKDKKKEKGKSKVKEKKKKEESEEQEKKAKKKGFGAILRFGKKKEDKGAKGEEKGTLKTRTLKEEELEKMKEERERIGAKHQELRDKQVQSYFDQYSGFVGQPPDIDDDEMDPNYARVNHFSDRPSPQNTYRPSSPPVTRTLSVPREIQAMPAEREHIDGLYAKINKKQHPAADSGRPIAGNADRIQQLRKEYHQARREGFTLYEDDEGRMRPSDYEQHWVSGIGAEGNSHSVRFEGMERQYASLPRRGPPEPVEYFAGPQVIYKERELPYYPGMQPASHSTGNYAHAQDMKVTDYRYPQYYSPSSQLKGPHRQDVPPSPPPTNRAPASGDMGRTGHRGTSPDRYQFRSQDPRQKNPMTAAV